MCVGGVGWGGGGVGGREKEQQKQQKKKEKRRRKKRCIACRCRGRICRASLDLEHVYGARIGADKHTRSRALIEP